MRVVTLSDHPGDLLADAERERGQGAAQGQDLVGQARSRRDQARAEGRWLTWLRLALAVRRARREVARLRASASLPTGREEAIRAGRDAERRVADELARALDDDWLLVRGYRNRRGEIDGLLLGPRGLFAYEVKYRNATVYIRGDDWAWQKLDNYGNRVSRPAPMRDARDRSPSQQLTEPAGMLADWLRSRGQRAPVLPVVLLTHPNARIGASQRPTVAVETSVRGLLRMVGQSRVQLTPSQRAEAERLIIRDHHHHEQRRARAPRAQRRARLPRIIGTLCLGDPGDSRAD